MVIILTVLGPVWPGFVWFRPITIGLGLTLLYAAVWAGSVAALAKRHGWPFLLFFLAAPIVLYWPLMYAFMVSCLSNQSCP